MTIDRTLPNYTLKEELISAISHGLGAVLALAGTALAVPLAAGKGALALFAAIFYGVSMILTYTVSCIYHSLRPNGGKKVMRILDHCFIFLLIAGTYAPFSLLAVGGIRGGVLFGAVAASGVIGIVLNAIDLKRFRVPSMICCLASGWAVILLVRPLAAALPPSGLWLLIAGGIVYTAGAVVYGIGAKVPFMHSVWHFFVLGGSVLQYFSVLYSILLA